MTLVFFLVADGMLAIVPVFIGRFVAALAHTPLDTQQVYWYAGILIFLSVGHDLTWRTAELFFLKFINGRNYEYDNVVFHNVITRKYPYFVGKFTGKISSYVGTLGREYREFVTTVCYTYADQLVKLPIIAGIMFTVNALTGVVFVVSLLLMTITGRLTIKRMATEEQRATDANSSMDGYIIDVISNFVSVKAFKKEQVEQQEVIKKRAQVIQTANRALWWRLVFWASLSPFVRYIIWPATILINVHLFLQGKISLAEITTFMSALTIFSDYIWGTIWNVSQFTLKAARTEEAYQYLFGKRNIVAAYKRQASRVAEGSETPTYSKDLIFHDLRFAYPDKKDRLILKGLDLQVAKNEKVGVVGRSGSGKTTLIKLLLGYYPVKSGNLLLDGQPVVTRQLTNLISYVPQDTSLFHRTIGENIAYGVDGQASKEAIEKAAKRAHAHEFIVDTPHGYDTLVGERGIKLSMGQRQRIAIARAFLDNKPLLILDEATSALDSESEVLVQQALEDLWHDKTVIAIAHRLSTLRHMDRIVVMDGGLIVEQGTHKELLAQKGHYYRLWQHQSGGMITED